MPNTERKILLEKLLKFEQPVEKTLADLRKFGWESDENLVHLVPAHIINILDAYLTGKLSAAQIEEWANALECREDLDFIPENEGIIRKIMFKLANPLLNEPITPEWAKSLKVQLSQ